MSTDRDTTRIVRSWLRTDGHESADRVLDDVLALLDATPQRRSLWPARRIADMNTFAKLALAAAAVVVVALVGINLLPTSGGVGGPNASPWPSSSASASPSPSQLPSQRPEPSPVAGAFPDAGPLSTGRHTFSQSGVDFTLEIAAPGWSSAGISVAPDGGNMLKSVRGSDTGIWMLFWSIDGVYSDPCGHVASPPVSPSAADLAAAVATLPGTELVSGPSDVTVGGRAAKHVVINIPADIDCGPNQFSLWYDDVPCGGGDPCGRWATAIGEINRVWIIEADGKHIWIEAETYLGAGPELDQEIQQMIDSIQFE